MPADWAVAADVEDSVWWVEAGGGHYSLPDELPWAIFRATVIRRWTVRWPIRGWGAVGPTFIRAAPVILRIRRWTRVRSLLAVLIAILITILTAVLWTVLRGLGKCGQSRYQKIQDRSLNHSHVEKAPSGRYLRFIVAHTASEALVSRVAPGENLGFRPTYFAYGLAGCRLCSGSSAMRWKLL